jgi:hypothetical protein
VATVAIRGTSGHEKKSSFAHFWILHRHDGQVNAAMVNVIRTAWLSVEEAGRAVFNWLDFDPATLNGKNDFVDECGNLEGHALRWQNRTEKYEIISLVAAHA